MQNQEQQATERRQYFGSSNDCRHGLRVNGMHDKEQRGRRAGPAGNPQGEQADVQRDRDPGMKKEIDQVKADRIFSWPSISVSRWFTASVQTVSGREAGRAPPI